MGYNRVQLKESVKQSMRMTTSKPMLVTLAFTAIVSVVSGLLNRILGLLFSSGTNSYLDIFLHYIERGYEVEDAIERTLETVMDSIMFNGPSILLGVMVGSAIVSFVVSLWQSTMNVGYEGYCLAMVRNQNPPLEKIFCALPQIGAVLVSRILTNLFIFLWALLLYIAYFVVIAILAGIAGALGAGLGVALLALVMIPLTVGLVIGIIYITMRYALVDYALLDKGLSGMDAIRESKRLMTGRTSKAFGLQMSFYGWYLLEGVIIYAAVIVAVIPVITMAASGSQGGLIASAGFSLLIILAAFIGTVVLSLWLKPYATGALAKF